MDEALIAKQAKMRARSHRYRARTCSPLESETRIAAARGLTGTLLKPILLRYCVRGSR
jgi:hypothetical protein